LAVYEKNQNWREEILAIEEKIHFWRKEILADFGGFLVNPPKFLAAKISSLKVVNELCSLIILVDLSWEDGFYLNLDDYLLGVLQLTNELSRLCVNLVIAGDYERPLRIARFISELDAAFRLLNLKNDSLRKKFDGLKYDLKKCEEVVYDLSIRGLKTLASKK